MADSRGRVYEVADKDVVGSSRLVDAVSPAAALRHVAGNRYDVSIANGRRVGLLTASGVTVEVAKTSLPIAGEAS